MSTLLRCDPSLTLEIVLVPNVNVNVYKMPTEKQEEPQRSKQSLGQRMSY